jgi:hypothetical protein
LDNVRFHHSTAVAETTTRAGHHLIFRLKCRVVANPPVKNASIKPTFL